MFRLILRIFIIYTHLIHIRKTHLSSSISSIGYRHHRGMASTPHITHSSVTTALLGWRSPSTSGKISLASEPGPNVREENAHGQVYRTGRSRVKLHGRDRRPQRPTPRLPRRRDQRPCFDLDHRSDPSPTSPLPRGRRLAGWLHEVLAPHVQEIVVTAAPKNGGSKSDKHDAFALADMMRIGSIPSRVYKQRGRLPRLAYLALPIPERACRCHCCRKQDRVGVPARRL
jgi:hypothetical protein